MKIVKHALILLITAAPVFGMAQTKFSAKDEALKLFYAAKPGIEKTEEGVMEEPNIVTGDINGDGRPDCIISYILNQKDSGNMIVGTGHLIYLNTGTGMQSAGRFPGFKFCFTVKGIKNQQILIRKYTCAPPYNDDLGMFKLAYRGGKIVEVR